MMFIVSQEINQEKEAAYAHPSERTTDMETNGLIHFLMDGGTRNQEKPIAVEPRADSCLEPFSAYTTV